MVDGRAKAVHQHHHGPLVSRRQKVDVVPPPAPAAPALGLQRQPLHAARVHLMRVGGWDAGRLSGMGGAWATGVGVAAPARHLAAGSTALHGVSTREQTPASVPTLASVRRAPIWTAGAAAAAATAAPLLPAPAAMAVAPVAGAPCATAGGSRAAAAAPVPSSSRRLRAAAVGRRCGGAATTERPKAAAAAVQGGPRPTAVQPAIAVMMTCVNGCTSAGQEKRPRVKRHAVGGCLAESSACRLASRVIELG